MATSTIQALPSPTPQAHGTAPCKVDYYGNSNGVCVHRLVKSQDSSVPAGTTTQYRNGSYSFS
ncbi:MAG TPA: DUF3761 domain-containing protein [Candidatus Angelobacter sp.]|nr:DUF3761 domain-containing protein [Candidatus Angelobacter sp.]